MEVNEPIKLIEKAMEAERTGDIDAAIALYQKVVHGGGENYFELLDVMRRKAIGASATAEDAKELLKWAKKAKEAGVPAADTFIASAEMILQAGKLGVEPAAPSKRQAAASLTEKMAEAMKAAGAPDKAEELLTRVRQEYGWAAPAGGAWVCGCGAENTGDICEYCGTPRP